MGQFQYVSSPFRDVSSTKWTWFSQNGVLEVMVCPIFFSHTSVGHFFFHFFQEVSSPISNVATDYLKVSG